MTDEIREEVHTEASSAATELMANAKNTECFIMAWIDDQGIFHWRNCGSTFTMYGIAQHISDLTKKDLMSDAEGDEDES